MITLVCGCIGAGKTTYIMKHKSDEDVMLDVDMIIMALSGKKMYEKPGNCIFVATELRDYVLNNAKRYRFNIWASSTMQKDEAEINAHRLGARLIFLDPGRDLCIKNVSNRERWELLVPLIDQWYKKHNNLTKKSQIVY